MRVEQIGNLTLVCADCMEVIKGIGDFALRAQSGVEDK